MLVPKFVTSQQHQEYPIYGVQANMSGLDLEHLNMNIEQHL